MRPEDREHEQPGGNDGGECVDERQKVTKRGAEASHFMCSPEAIVMTTLQIRARPGLALMCPSHRAAVHSLHFGKRLLGKRRIDLRIVGCLQDLGVLEELRIGIDRRLRRNEFLL